MTRTIDLATAGIPCCADPLYSWLRLLVSYLGPPVPLAAPLTAAATTMQVGAVCVDFPLPCLARIDGEEVSITFLVAPGRYTIARHQNGTAAAAHADGALVTPLTKIAGDAGLLYCGADPLALYSSATSWLDPYGGFTELKCNGTTWHLKAQVGVYVAGVPTAQTINLDWKPEWSSCHPTRLVFHQDALTVAGCALSDFTAQAVCAVVLSTGIYPAVPTFQRRNGEEVWELDACGPVALPAWCLGLDAPPPPVYAHFSNGTGACACLNGLTVALTQDGARWCGGCCVGNAAALQPCPGQCGDPPADLGICLFQGDASTEEQFPGSSQTGSVLNALLGVTLGWCKGTSLPSCDPQPTPLDETPAPGCGDPPAGWPGTAADWCNFCAPPEGCTPATMSGSTLVPGQTPQLAAFVSDDGCFVFCQGDFHPCWAQPCPSYLGGSLPYTLGGISGTISFFTSTNAYTNFCNEKFWESTQSAACLGFCLPTGGCLVGQATLAGSSLVVPWKLQFRGFQPVPTFETDCDGHDVQVGTCDFCVGGFDVLLDTNP